MPEVDSVCLVDDKRSGEWSCLGGNSVELRATSKRVVDSVRRENSADLYTQAANAFRLNKQSKSFCSLQTDFILTIA